MECRKCSRKIKYVLKAIIKIATTCKLQITRYLYSTINVALGTRTL